MLRSTTILLFIVFLAGKSLAQADFYSWDFFVHLKASQLNKNALDWLNSYPDSLKDEKNRLLILQEKAGLFVSERQTDSANNCYKSILHFSDTIILHQAICIAFVEKDTAAVGMYQILYPDIFEKSDYAYSYSLLKGSPDNNDTLMNQEIFKTSIPEYRMSLNSPKKTYVAGLLSVIPGAGKYYLGFHSQARTAFIVNVLLGGVLTEVLLVPAAPVLVGFSLLLTTVFYIGNIWGTLILPPKIKGDASDQLYEDISIYYFNRLYP